MKNRSVVAVVLSLTCALPMACTHDFDEFVIGDAGTQADGGSSGGDTGAAPDAGCIPRSCVTTATTCVTTCTNKRNTCNANCKGNQGCKDTCQKTAETCVGTCRNDCGDCASK
ncbi:MAG: hypothetical protein JWM74_5801, partial [Myxococcaceae bacterium]|nr:hypothetical protein [Myxococcaceae bacterium]